MKDVTGMFFGSIRQKLYFAFGCLILLLVFIVVLTFNLNSQIIETQIELREVESPLRLMVERVIGYDAILTGSAHESLLHIEKGEFTKFQEHKLRYDQTSILLDDLLKVKASELIDRSKRSREKKDKVRHLLSELGRVNLLLVDLETRAFEAMENGDSGTARKLIVTDDYEQYKAELLNLSLRWEEIETEVSEEYRQKILTNSKNVQIYNLGFGFIFILVGIIISFVVSRNISIPVKNLYDATLMVENGDLKNRVNIKTGDELEYFGDEFNKMVEQLERIDQERKQVDKAKTEFLSITSHELRSPMTPMKAQLQMVLEGYFGRLTKEQRDSLLIVLNNTERLDKILLDFLEISRIEAARLKFDFVKTSLNRPIKSVIEEMKHFMPEKKIRFDAVINDLPMIEVDPDRVMQVLRNLINNAIKFSKDKGKIEISVKKERDFIFFTVKDYGEGIPDQDQLRIFEPFFQSGGMYARKFGGSGLGLAICKGIVESQNGRIWFVSKKGVGTTFHFTIPVKPVKEMKPIKMLFSGRVRVERDVKNFLIDALGPLGSGEFDNLQKQGITAERVIKYLELLKEKGIITGRLEQFKKKIKLIFQEEKKGVKQFKDGE